MKNQYLFLWVAAMCSSMVLHAQKMFCGMYELPTEAKISAATHIFEGEVIDAESFWAEDSSMIYTAYRLAVFKVFKGDVFTSNVQLIVQGGRVGYDLVHLTSNLELSVGSMGVFLCQPVSRFPSGKSAWGSSFEVYASKQGFFQYDPVSLIATDVFHVFPNPLFVYDLLGEGFTFVQSPFSARLRAIDPSEPLLASVPPPDTIFYGFENPALVSSGTDYFVEADIMISANKTLDFERGEAIIGYSTAAFGTNLVNSGNLTVTKGVVLNGSTYTLAVTDYASDAISIVCEYAGPAGRTSIYGQEQQLVKVSLNVTNLVQNPNIAFLEPDMQGESEFFNGSNGQLFDVVKTSESLGNLVMTSPIITDVVALDTDGLVAAGDLNNVGVSLVEIVGMNFGILGPNSKIIFRNAEYAPELGNFPFEFFSMNPLSEDIISWSDTSIFVQVPSRNIPDNVTNPSNRIAGTGWVGVQNNDSQLGYSNPVPTQPGLDISYALRTYYIDDPNDPQYLPFPVAAVLVDDTNDGFPNGYGFKYSDNAPLAYQGKTFFDTPDARAAFERALQTWRCNVLVNFEIDSAAHPLGASVSDGVNSISFEPLSAGLGTGAITKRFIFPCTSGSTIAFTGYTTDIDIRFNSSPDTFYHFGTSAPPAGLLDFESLALHEIGHALNLEHTSTNVLEVMYPYYQPGSIRRDLLPNDLLGGNRMMDLSTVQLNACPSPIGYYGGEGCGSNSINQTNPPAISFYPSPFDKSFTIKPNTSYWQSARVVLTDLTGRIVYQKQFDASNHNLGPLVIEPDKSLSYGVYHVTLLLDEQVFIGKIVKTGLR